MKSVLLRYTCCMMVASCMSLQAEELGGWSISQQVVDWIRATLPRGSVILECGSGYGSGILSLYYEIHSIEHNSYWLGKYRGPHYIYAPIVDRWYDVERLKCELPSLTYNLILVDGPNGEIGRKGFFENLDLFNVEGTIIVFDDIDRKAEFDLMMAVAHKLGRTPKKLVADSSVGILMP